MPWDHFSHSSEALVAKVLLLRKTEYYKEVTITIEAKTYQSNCSRKHFGDEENFHPQN